MRASGLQASARRRPRVRRMLAAIAGAALLLAAGRPAAAHPLGNFTINRYSRLEVGAARVAVRYVVDLAEIPAYQAMQALGADSSSLPAGALRAYGERMAVQYGDGIALTVDGARVPLQPAAHRVSIPAGSGGLPTLRLEIDLTGALPAAAGAVRHLRYEDTNQRHRIGWNEIVVGAAPGVNLFDSSAFGTAVTDALRTYPDPTLTGTLDERSATLSFTSGPPPAGAVPPRRDGTPSAPSRDRFAELISVPELTPGAALLGLLFAAVLGGLHALSPGHGKTVVGAYLVGARGTARHAAFLGLTVTVTHTLGVFALGLVTLFASHYVVPERLFPVLSFTSGALIVGMGLTLFVTRLRAAVGAPLHRHHDHDHGHAHHPHDHVQHHHHADAHGHAAAPLPPGADGSPVPWRNLLALGVSGGMLPCPSALVVLLAAIALNRVGYGLLLIVAFSAGLAGVLTAGGLTFVYASRLMKRPSGSRWVGALPVLSALVVAAAGAAICREALRSAGIDPLALLTSAPEASPGLLSTVSVLGLGLLFGLKHAFEADHVAAVSIIVSERRSFWSSSLVGAVWGVGHTISLLAAGVLVILLHIEISDRVALGLEFCVALMLIGLGANALRTLRRGGRLHVHAHSHGDRLHLHPHLHDPTAEPPPHTHHGIGVRPLVVGMVHGLAGSAALMLLVLSSIPSPLLGFAYIGIFGIGSIGGMFGVSALMTLPVHFTATRFARTNTAVRMLAALFSLGFGLSMAYQIGIVEGLLL